MQFNPSKCQVLQITKRAKPLNTKYILHTVEMESVSAAKYLGVTIEDDLSLTKHIDITTRKANQTFGFLKRNIRVHNKALNQSLTKLLCRCNRPEFPPSQFSPHSPVRNVSGYRCVSDCRSRGHEFNPGPVPYFRGD